MRLVVVTFGAVFVAGCALDAAGELSQGGGGDATGELDAASGNGVDGAIEPPGAVDGGVVPTKPDGAGPTDATDGSDRADASEPTDGSDASEDRGDATGTTVAMDAAADSPTSAAREKSITFDGTKVAGALVDFPAWIDLVDAQVAARAQDDGHDLFFTGSNGEPLAHEVQRWDRASGHLTAWVRVPQLASPTPTKIYLHYGDPTAAPMPTPAATFSSAFAAVWHLEDALTSNGIAEATGTHPGTGVNLVPAQQGAAKLGGGVQFTGASDEISFTNPIAGTGSHTISLWVSQTATTDNDALVVIGNGSCGQSRWLHSRFNAPTAAVGFYCNDWANPNVDIVNAGWTLLHWVFDSATNTSVIYRDGVAVAGPYAQSVSTIDTQGSGGHLGNAPSAWGANMGAHATLDEVRIATVARSPEWIATEFANQSSPGTFYAVGAEQLVP
jgi:MSHA biogenesis protein MshQ